MSALLRVNQLQVSFPVHAGFFRKKVDEIRAVHDVSFTIEEGRTLGLVGESGSGKSTVARAILKLTKATGGEVFYRDREILSLGESAFRPLRKEMQMVFQDPFGSLNPRMTVEEIIAEPLRIHFRQLDRAERREQVASLLQRVGLQPESMTRYPHEFSGGQRQRIGIARALAVQPKFLICDEPVSALDVSVQAQIINLLRDLQRDLGLTIIFIAHDLSVVRHISDRVAVMYLGKIVEIGDELSIYSNPSHPYTQALLSAVPVPDPVGREDRKRIVLQGDVPSPANPPSGCRFRTRCWKAQDLCAQQEPPLIQIGTKGGQFSACHFPEVRDIVDNDVPTAALDLSEMPRE